MRLHSALTRQTLAHHLCELLITLALFACARPVRAGLPVNFAIADVSCRPDPNGGELKNVSSFFNVSATCLYEQTTPSGVEVSATSGATGRLTLPTPDTYVSAEVNMTPGSVEPNDYYEAGASASITYYLAILSRGLLEPPYPFPPFSAQIPITVVGKAFGRAGKHGNAGAGVTFGPVLVAATNYLLFGESQTVTGEAQFSLYEGEQYTIKSSAICSAMAALAPPLVDEPSDSCAAFADPIVEFDQETFDQRWGAQSFPLADYYEIEFSPNLATGYDLADDWSDLSNPNGVWSLQEGANPLPHVDAWEPASFSTAQPAWARSAESNTRIPSWMKMSAPFAPTHDWQDGDVVVHTGDDTNGVGSGPARVVWTSPGSGMISVFGAVWMGREIGRGNHWELSFDGVPLTSGDISSGDAYDRENPFELASGSAGSSALTAIPVSPGDTLALTITRTSQYGDFVGVNLSVDLPEPSQAQSFGVSALVILAIRFRARWYRR